MKTTKKNEFKAEELKFETYFDEVEAKLEEKDTPSIWYS
jgi:hypothetical protein